MLVCEYVGGAVGAIEGFAILRFSPDNIELHTLPLTDFGKVVVFKEKPEQAEIWSALPYPSGSDADPRHMPHRLVIGRRRLRVRVLPSGSMAASGQQLSTIPE